MEQTTKLWNRNFSLVILASTMGTIGGIAGSFALASLSFDAFKQRNLRLSRRDTGLSVVHYDWRNVHLTGRFCSDFRQAKSASQAL